MASANYTRKPLQLALQDHNLSYRARDLARMLLTHQDKTDEETFRLFTLMGNSHQDYEPLREEILRAGYKASRRY